MPWQCFIVEDSSQATKPGAMYPVHNERDNCTNWYVFLPSRQVFNIHSKTGDGTGWQITGEAPNFTLSPSINCHEIKLKDGSLWKKGWHGYLQNGILSDDVDGRSY